MRMPQARLVEIADCTEACEGGPTGGESDVVVEIVKAGLMIAARGVHACRGLSAAWEGGMIGMIARGLGTGV